MVADELRHVFTGQLTAKRPEPGQHPVVAIRHIATAGGFGSIGWSAPAWRRHAFRWS
jgi:hypothetical protein